MADHSSSPLQSTPPRRRLLRDLIVFQGKLFLDGVRDLALSPASLVLALIDLMSGDRSGGRFYNLLALGKRSDHWINLFGAASKADAAPPPPAEIEQADEDPADTDATQVSNVDDVVERVEGLIREQYRSGTMSDSARRAISRGLQKFRTGRRPADTATATATAPPPDSDSDSDSDSD